MPVVGRLIAARSQMSHAKTYVYVLKSKSDSAQYYTGADEGRSVRFERYLKTGSGVAFAKRHLR